MCYALALIMFDDTSLHFYKSIVHPDNAKEDIDVSYFEKVVAVVLFPVFFILYIIKHMILDIKDPYREFRKNIKDKENDSKR